VGRSTTANIYVKTTPKNERSKYPVGQARAGNCGSSSALVARREPSRSSKAISVAGFKQIQVQGSRQRDRPRSTRPAHQAARTRSRTSPARVDIGLSSKGLKPEVEVQLKRGVAGSLGITAGTGRAGLCVPAFRRHIDAGDWVDPTRQDSPTCAFVWRPMARPSARPTLAQIPLVGRPARMARRRPFPLGEVSRRSLRAPDRQSSTISTARAVVNVELNVSGRGGG